MSLIPYSVFFSFFLCMFNLETLNISGLHDLFTIPPHTHQYISTITATRTFIHGTVFDFLFVYLFLINGILKKYISLYLKHYSALSVAPLAYVLPGEKFIIAYYGMLPSITTFIIILIVTMLKCEKKAALVICCCIMIHSQI